MNKLSAALLILLSAGAYAQDCPKNTDACSAPKKVLSPFLAAAAEPQPAKPLPVAKKTPTAPKAEPAAPEVAASSVPAAVPASPKAPSSPLWLLFIAGSLAGLYFYLGAGTRKGKKK